MPRAREQSSVPYFEAAQQLKKIVDADPKDRTVSCRERGASGGVADLSGSAKRGKTKRGPPGIALITKPLVEIWTNRLGGFSITRHSVHLRSEAGGSAARPCARRERKREIGE